MKITVTISAHVGIPGYVPNASEAIEITADTAPAALTEAVQRVWTELQAGLAADRALLAVGD